MTDIATPSPGEATVDGKYYQVVRPGSLSERMLIKARDAVFESLVACTGLSDGDTVLDVGTSDVLSDGANVLERRLASPSRITAAGLGEAQAFRKAFPQVRYVRVEAGEPLPFADMSFDVATANAVLEHVGGKDAQKAFVSEIARVSRRAYLSVPHRYFPVEHHTAIPVAHWWDATFRPACRLLGKEEWLEESNLRLMTLRRLAEVVPPGYRWRTGRTGLPLGPFSSNLYLYLEREAG